MPISYMTFCLFLSGSDQSQNTSHFVKKVICSIFNTNLFDISHLYVLNCIQWNCTQ